MQDPRITVGHNVNGRPTHTTADVCAACARVLGTEALTAIPCLGVWRGQAEESTRAEVCALTDAEAARMWALLPDLAAALGQVEIMAELKPSRVAFVAASAAVAVETA